MSVAEILARRRQRQVAPVVSPASSFSSSIMSSYTTARPAPVVTQPAPSSAPLLAPPSHYPQFEEKTVEHVVSEDVYPPDEPRLLEFPPVMSPSLPPAHKSLFSDVKASLASLQSTIQNMSLGVYVTLSTATGPPTQVALFLAVDRCRVTFAEWSRTKRSLAGAKQKHIHIPSIKTIACISTEGVPGIFIQHEVEGVLSELCFDFPSEDSRDEWAYGLGCLHEMIPLRLQ